MNENSLVTVATFSFPHEAHIARIALESEDIPAFIADEHTINMQWLYSNAMGGVRVQVPFKFVKDAKIILETNLAPIENDDDFNRSCSACGSKKLVPYTKGKKPAFIVFLLLGFPLFFYKHGYKCEECGAFNET